ncbi:MAG: sugar phosphate isomerase/epimerase [Cyclobacteriaceae bacterium]|nr:sugar phosphate isomerase/epimerase [Cyclobacteriaceae bacterium]MDH5249089.1 sugar phosphate isomerase/epimerase [Cyclobacteriaceae bacterium]
MDITSTERRAFLKNLALMSALGFLPTSMVAGLAKKTDMKLGLVTYLWGKDWDVPTIIKNCSAASIFGVELRTEHAHGIEPALSDSERSEVKKKFADSPVKIVGLGTNQQYDFAETDKVKESIKKTAEFIKLSHDIGGSGVKVKPNAFHIGIPHEKTIEQIGRSLNEVGKIAGDYGQKIRLEVHGNETQELPNIKAIMDVADNKAVVVCWNCNDEDLLGGGLEYNFNLVKKRLGDTVHVREMNIGSYPYQDLMALFVKMNYSGWILLECRTDPDDKVSAMIEQRDVFQKMIAKK